MAYECPGCGWKDKPSHKKYYKKRGLIRPICVKCNPCFVDRVKRRYFSFIRGAFLNTYMGYGPLAAIPYVPLIILLSAFSSFIAPNNLEYVVGFLCCALSYLGVVLITQRVGDIITKRLNANKTIAKIVLIYYLPLVFSALAGGVLWYVKMVNNQ